MQNQPDSRDAMTLAPPPPPPPPPPPQMRDPTGPRARGRTARVSRWVVIIAAVAVVVGVLLGGRASAEDGRAAAAAALARGNPGRAVILDEAVAGRSGLLMLLDPGAADAAAVDAQVARLAWARSLAAGGSVDAAVAALTAVRAPSLAADAAQTRTQILIAAAAGALKAGDADLALQRLDEASLGSPPPAARATIAAMRGNAEVSAAAELVAANHASDAVALLDLASARGASAAALAEYPVALLAAAKSEIAAVDFVEATRALTTLLDEYGASAQSTAARQLLTAPQTVSGTLVDDLGHAALGRVRLATHFTALSGGYITSGPFYYGVTGPTGDFTIPLVPVGGPYVLEYFRGGGWMTLVDPRTDQPADRPVVDPLQPKDLTFIVLP